ncbi:MAG: PEGA domain-containing protein [candidate division WOR-3 bacterium]|nr:MAG: PEGA domain-containing protein [candidate division WOR-3 bacterium]
MRCIYGIVTLVALIGCATITRGTHEALVIDSKPAAASVVIKEGETVLFTGLTPTSAKLARKGEYLVIIEKDGYESLRVNVTHEISDEGGVATAGNCIAGGCIGLGVDAGSGATMNLKPNPISVDLIPVTDEQQ